MDTVTTAIIAALSAGAASGLTDAAKKAISDSYESLKGLLQKKFGSGSNLVHAVDRLQARPDSDAAIETLAAELKAVNAFAEPELLAAARSLLQLLEVGAQKMEMTTQVAVGPGTIQRPVAAR